jgi:hypothetical protein
LARPIRQPGNPQFVSNLGQLGRLVPVRRSFGRPRPPNFQMYYRLAADGPATAKPPRYLGGWRARFAPAAGWFHCPLRGAARVRRPCITRLPMGSANLNWRRVLGKWCLDWNLPALDPPRYLGGYQRQIYLCNGSIHLPLAGSRQRPEADPDQAPAYGVRKSQMAAGLARTGPGLEIARGGSPRPAGGERARVRGPAPERGTPLHISA